MKLRFDFKLVDGIWQPLNTGRFPKIREGAVAELVIEDDHINDPSFESQRRDAIELVLDVAEGVAVNLRGAVTEPSSHDRVRNVAVDGFFSIVIPEKPIRIVKKPGQRPRLQPVPVHLPDLGNEKATSLNNACTKLSEHFETERLSHTYSAFEVVFLCRNNSWIPLKELI